MPESFCKKKKLGRCNLQIAPPYMIVLDARVILQEKKNWAVQFTNYSVGQSGGLGLHLLFSEKLP
jgi:hypothetical protein